MIVRKLINWLNTQIDIKVQIVLDKFYFLYFLSLAYATLSNLCVFHLHHLIKFVVRIELFGLMWRNVQSVRLIICCYWLLGFIRSLRNCNLQGPIPDLSTIPRLTYL
ncbi:hypothetical protein V8G54_037139 [Vigna mungo]|uniref:Uncharacterized protein n=1 Tax=Vigna mungo TaxID=3915 RepID=A0AAQ3MIP0_VIGMU